MAQPNFANIRVVVTLALFTWMVTGCGDRPDQLIESAKSYLAAKDHKAAVIQLKNALQKAPENGEVRYLLGQALMDAGDAASAEIELRKARDLKYRPELVYPALGRALLAQRQPRKAVSELEGAALSDPAAGADLNAVIGQARLALRQTKEARLSFAAALSVKPDHPAARLGMAQAAALEGDLPGAVKAVDEILEKFPSDTDALALKGALLAYQGRTDAALEAYEKALATDPRKTAIRSSLIELLLSRGALDRASAHVDELKKIAPKSPRTLFFQAWISMERGDLTAARDSILQVLKVAPGHVPALTLAGAVAYRTGSLAQAEENLTRALEKAPGHVSARRLLVAVYLAKGQPDRAREDLQTLLDQRPGDSRVLALAGEVYLANRELAKAAEYYEKAAALDKDNPALRARLGAVHFASGEGDEAVQDLEMASAMDPSRYQADLGLVAIHLARNQPDKALAAARALEKKQPDNPVTHNVMGAVHIAKRDLASARSSFERALELRPAFVPAARSLALLDLREKKPEAAKDRFRAVLAKEPNNEQALAGLAEILRVTGAPRQEVDAALRKTVSANAGSAVARLALINFRLRSGDPKGTLAAAREALAALPEDAQIAAALGVAQQASGEINQAIATFTKLAQGQPRAVDPLLRLADAYRAAKDDGSALQALRKALTVRPDSIPALRGVAELQVAAGRHADALGEIRAWQKRHPGHAYGYVLEGYVLTQQKKPREAEKAYREGLKRAPHPDLAVRLHALVSADGRGAEARAFAAKWMREHPNDAAMPVYLAELEIRKGDFASAVGRYKAILERQPGNPLVLNNLAWAASKLKDPEALSYAERAYALAPNSSAILDTYGWMLFEQGALDRSLELLARATDLAPNAWEIRLHYAKALAKAGKKDAARTELETLSKLDSKLPQQQEAAAMLRDL